MTEIATQISLCRGSAIPAPESPLIIVRLVEAFPLQVQSGASTLVKYDRVTARFLAIFYSSLVPVLVRPAGVSLLDILSGLLSLRSVGVFFPSLGRANRRQAVGSSKIRDMWGGKIKRMSRYRREKGVQVYVRGHLMLGWRRACQERSRVPGVVEGHPSRSWEPPDTAEVLHKPFGSMHVQNRSCLVWSYCCIRGNSCCSRFPCLVIGTMGKWPGPDSTGTSLVVSCIGRVKVCI